MDNWEKLGSWRDAADMTEKRAFFSCVLYVLKALDADLLRSIWSNEVHSRLVVFMDILKVCAKVFEVK